MEGYPHSILVLIKIKNERKLKMKLLILGATLVSHFVAQIAFGHGEDKPGPNGGFIRMPSAFHTEVILTSPNTLKVFLLDMQWKNPSIKDSSLSVNHTKDKALKTKCSIESNYYVCILPKDVDLNKKGELLVGAKREGQEGMTVSYELPLKLQKVDDGHGSHH